jgi:hypothetical protein
MPKATGKAESVMAKINDAIRHVDQNKDQKKH